VKNRINHCILPALLLGVTTAVAAQELRNWFDDPFFQVRKGSPDCPTPLGPFLPQSKRNAEGHYRIERGTSCWLAGKCDRANAYWYDAGIGKAVEKAFADTPDFVDASLWVTVQRRFITVEGCVASPEAEEKLAALLQPLPDVERVIVQVRKPGDPKLPYAVLPDGMSHGK
jgi:hypothetical protein